MQRGFGGLAVLYGFWVRGAEVAWRSACGMAGGKAAVERVAWLSSGRWGIVGQRWACLGVERRVGRNTGGGGGLGGRLGECGGFGNGGQALSGMGLGSSGFGGVDENPLVSENEPESGPMAAWGQESAHFVVGNGGSPCRA